MGANLRAAGGPRRSVRREKQGSPATPPGVKSRSGSSSTGWPSRSLVPTCYRGREPSGVAETQRRRRLKARTPDQHGMHSWPVRLAPRLAPHYSCKQTHHERKHCTVNRLGIYTNWALSPVSQKVAPKVNTDCARVVSRGASNRPRGIQALTAKQNGHKHKDN